MTKTAGVFVTIEGGEGTGKSTLARSLADTIASREVVLTREPGGSPGAEEIRALLVSGAAERWDGMTELLLVNAARRNHVERVVRPALARGAVVICDRYIDSTRAYQGLRGIERTMIDWLHERAIGLDPIKTLILDVPSETGLTRAATRGGDARFESMGDDYHAALRVAFRAIAEAEPQRCTLIDATQPKEIVRDKALGALAAVLV